MKDLNGKIKPKSSLFYQKAWDLSFERFIENSIEKISQ